MASSYRQGLGTSASLMKDGGGRKIGRVGRSDRYTSGKKAYYKGSEIQNIKSARVYVFGDGDHVVDDENVVFEMPEMRSRLKAKGYPNYTTKPYEEQPEYFMKEIADGETLQAIALRYACPISELKRLNKLIQDQEFFALKVLKVPMRKYGILSEEIANDHKNVHVHRPADGDSFSPDTDTEHSSNYFEENDSQHDFSDPDIQIKIMRTLSIRDNFSDQDKDAEKFLKRMDDDLKKHKQSSRLERESLTEVISMLTNKSIHPLQTNRISGKLKGATCGLSWWSIILILVVIGIIVPVVLFLYIKYVLNNHE